MALIGFLVYRTVLNYQKSIKETGTPESEEQAATSTEGEVEGEKEAPQLPYLRRWKENRY